MIPLVLYPGIKPNLNMRDVRRNSVVRRFFSAEHPEYLSVTMAFIFGKLGYNVPVGPTNSFFFFF